MPEIGQLGGNCRGIVHIFAPLTELNTNPCVLVQVLERMRQKVKREDKWVKKEKLYSSLFSFFI